MTGLAISLLLSDTLDNVSAKFLLVTLICKKILYMPKWQWTNYWCKYIDMVSVSNHQLREFFFLMSDPISPTKLASAKIMYIKYNVLV